MERNDWFLVSTHLLLIKENNILLYLRKWWLQDWKYNLIAWHLDWGETPIEATVREAEEEAWIIIKNEDLYFSHVSYSIAWNWKEYIQFYFTCEKWKWEIINKELDRCYEMEFFPITNLPENTTSYIKQAILNYKNWLKYSD